LVVGGIVAVLVVAAAAVAWLLLNPTVEGEPLAACVLVIDRTSSATGSASSAAHYEQMADKAIAGCADAQAVLVIGSFDQSGTSVDFATNANAGGANDKEFPLYPGTGRSAGRREGARQDALEAARGAVREILTESAERNRGSDLLVAIDQAADAMHRLVESSATITRQYLVLLTDGIQISDDYSFATFTEGGDATAYAKAASLGTDLSGVSLSFAGVGSGTSAGDQQLASWFEQMVQEFWRAYVEMAGGTVCEYAPDPVRLPVGC